MFNAGARRLITYRTRGSPGVFGDARSSTSAHLRARVKVSRAVRKKRSFMVHPEEARRNLSRSWRTDGAKQSRTLEWRQSRVRYRAAEAYAHGDGQAYA